MSDRIKEAYRIFHASLIKYNNGSNEMTKKKARYILGLIHRIPRKKFWIIMHELHEYKLIELTKSSFLKIKN